MQNFVEWMTKYETGIDFIDEQHKILIKIINDLYSGLQNCSLDKSEVFRKAASQAVDYVKKHFSQEEEWMLANDYPKYKYQKSEHDRFIKKLLEDSENFRDYNPRSAFDFVTFLRDWLISHIAIADNDFRFHNERIKKG